MNKTLKEHVLGIWMNLDDPDWLVVHMGVPEMGLMSFLLLPVVPTWSPMTLHLRTGILGEKLVLGELTPR